MFRNAIHTHIITSQCAAPLLIETAKNSGRTGLLDFGDGVAIRIPTGAFVLRFDKDHGDPAGLCHGLRAAQEECRGRRPHPGSLAQK